MSLAISWTLAVTAASVLATCFAFFVMFRTGRFGMAVWSGISLWAMQIIAAVLVAVFVYKTNQWPTEDTSFTFLMAVVMLSVAGAGSIWLIKQLERLS